MTCGGMNSSEYFFFIFTLNVPLSGVILKQVQDVKMEENNGFLIFQNYKRLLSHNFLNTG